MMVFKVVICAVVLHVTPWPWNYNTSVSMTSKCCQKNSRSMFGYSHQWLLPHFQLFYQENNEPPNQKSHQTVLTDAIILHDSHEDFQRPNWTILHIGVIRQNEKGLVTKADFSPNSGPLHTGLKTSWRTVDVDKHEELHLSSNVMSGVHNVEDDLRGDSSKIDMLEIVHPWWWVTVHVSGLWMYYNQW